VVWNLFGLWEMYYTVLLVGSIWKRYVQGQSAEQWNTQHFQSHDEALDYLIASKSINRFADNQSPSRATASSPTIPHGTSSISRSSDRRRTWSCHQVQHVSLKGVGTAPSLFTLTAAHVQELCMSFQARDT